MTFVGVALGVLLLAVTVGGIFFNSYILFFSCTKTNNQNRTASQLLLFHLGFLNLLLAVFFLAAFAPSFFKDVWLENTTCSFVGPVWDCLHIVAIWTVTSLNADKYVTIASPLHYARFMSPSRAGIALFVSWVIAALIVAPIPLFSGLSYKMRSSGCFLDVFSSSLIAGSVHACTTTFLGFILPILVVGLTNGRILVIASHHRHRIVAALWDVTLSAQATVTHQKSHFYLTNYKGRSAATTIFHHVGSLLIMYLPTTVCRIYEAVTRLKVNSTVATSAFILLAVSPTINGFVYGVRSKVLRKLLMHVLRKQLYKSEVSCEIQARTPSASCSRRPSMTPSITLPLQKQLTRRMSEIFTPTSNTPSVSSQNSCDGRGKLERQSSDISSPKGRSSEASTPKDLTPPSYRTPGLSPLSKFFPKGMHFQKSLDLSTPPGEASITTFLTGIQNNLNSSSFNRQGSLEMMTNGSSHNGGHRQSLRRALFARNKQKSLDLDTVNAEKEVQNLSKCPPRSASHHQMQEQQRSPSAVRPLILPSDPLTPARKSKKVSWSSDSFTNSDKSTHDSPFQSETDITKRWKKRGFFKQNGYKTNSKLSLERINSDTKENSDVKDNSNNAKDKHLNATNSHETVEQPTFECVNPTINVFDNPLSTSIPHAKVSKLCSPSEASMIAKIHMCH